MGISDGDKGNIVFCEIIFVIQSKKCKTAIRNPQYSLSILRNAEYLYIPDEPLCIFIYDRYGEGGGCVYLHNIAQKKNDVRRRGSQS